MKRLALSLLAASMLTACAPPTATVSGFNGDSVAIQQAQLVADEETARSMAMAEASRICGRVGRRAEYASTRILPNYIQEHLFLCLA